MLPFEPPIDPNWSIKYWARCKCNALAQCTMLRTHTRNKKTNQEINIWMQFYNYEWNGFFFLNKIQERKCAFAFGYWNSSHNHRPKMHRILCFVFLWKHENGPTTKCNNNNNNTGNKKITVKSRWDTKRYWHVHWRSETWWAINQWMCSAVQFAQIADTSPFFCSCISSSAMSFCRCVFFFVCTHSGVFDHTLARHTKYKNQLLPRFKQRFFRLDFDLLEFYFGSCDQSIWKWLSFCCYCYGEFLFFSLSLLSDLLWQFLLLSWLLTEWDSI